MSGRVDAAQESRLKVLAEHLMVKMGLVPSEEWPTLEDLHHEAPRRGLAVPPVWLRYVQARAAGRSHQASTALALAQHDSEDPASASRESQPALIEDRGSQDSADADSATERDGQSAPRRDQFPEYSDGANAEAFVRDHGQGLIFVAEIQTWFVWDSTRWVPDVDGEVERRAWITVQRMIEHAWRDFHAASDKKDRSAALARVKQAERCSYLKTVRQMIATARTHTKVVVRLDALDADGYLFNCANGTLDLRTGTLHRHKKADYITKLSPISYDPEAKAPTFRSFLERIFCGDRELLDYVQRLFGYALVGELVEHILPVAFGSGANGKTTLFEVLRSVFGDYAQQGTGDLLLHRNTNGGPSPDLARLPGARLVLVAETAEGHHWNEPLVKQLTGGDRIAARDLYKTLFEFNPVATIFLTTNHLPAVSATGEAMWRRLRVIPFLAVIPEPEQDPRLLARLRAEGAGILRWLVEGTLEWSKRSLGEVPATVSESTIAYRREADLVGRFIEECCELHDSYSVGAQELHRAFSAWAEANGSEPLTIAKFGRELNDRGFSKLKKGTVTRRGLRLHADSRTLAEPRAKNLLRGTP